MATENMTSITSKIAVSGVADEANNGVPAKVAATQNGWQEVIASRRGSVVEQAQISMEKVDKVVNELRDLVQTMRRDLNFHVDYVTGRVVIRVVETSTNRVVRQIPEEEVLSLARHLEEILDDMPKGVLIEGGT